MKIFKPKRIVLFIFGGTGNILFQLALAKYLKNSIGNKKVVLNLLLSKKNIITSKLGWTIHSKPDFINEMISEYDQAWYMKLSELFRLVKHLLKIKYNKLKYIDMLSDNMAIGYFQKLDKLAIPLDESVIEVSKKLKEALIEVKKWPCVIHHRSLENDWSKNVNMLEFYGLKLSEFSQVLVLTDSVDDALKIYTDSKYTIQVNDLLKDISLMTAADIFVASNSTLSFWVCLMRDKEYYFDFESMKNRLPTGLLKNDI